MSDQPRLRFIQINDLHFRDFRHEGEGHSFHGANGRAGWLMEALQKPGRLPPADFVLAIGDMVHGGSLESLGRECPTMAAALKELPMEVFPAIGNHEIKQAEGDPEWERSFREAYGVPDHYSFEREGIAFIVFNNAGTGDDLLPSVRRKRAANLQRMLDRHRNHRDHRCAGHAPDPQRRRPPARSMATRTSQLVAPAREGAGTRLGG